MTEQRPDIFDYFFAKDERQGRQRRHSIFGDFFIRDKKSPPPTDEELKDLELYNKLWRMYFNEECSGWGSWPTKGGFERWLQRKVREEEIRRTVRGAGL